MTSERSNNNASVLTVIYTLQIDVERNRPVLGAFTHKNVCRAFKQTHKLCTTTTARRQSFDPNICT